MINEGFRFDLHHLLHEHALRAGRSLPFKEGEEERAWSKACHEAGMTADRNWHLILGMPYNLARRPQQ